MYLDWKILVLFFSSNRCFEVVNVYNMTDSSVKTKSPIDSVVQTVGYFYLYQLTVLQANP